MTIDGTSSADSLVGTVGDDTINGLGGDDTLLGDLGNDVLNGDDDDDLLFGGGGNDTMNGGDGDDTLKPIDQPDPFGGFHFTQLNGGVGVDRAVLIGEFGLTIPKDSSDPSSSFGVTMMQSFGFIDVSLNSIEIIEFISLNPVFSRTFELVLGTADADALTGGGYGYGINAYAGDGDDTLAGSSFDDELAGGAGQDSIVGGAGFDSLIGGAGSDTLTGGAELDSYYFYDIAHVGGAGDVITDFEEGELLVFVDLDGLSGTIFIGEAAFSGAGNELRFERAGGQTIVEYDNDGDMVADGTVTITSGEFSLQTSSDFYEGALKASVITPATAGNDTIRGSVKGEVIAGLAGADNLNGELGDDTIDGGDGADTVYGGVGNDELNGGAGPDRFKWVTTFQIGVASDIVTDFEFSDALDFALISAFAGEPGGLNLIWLGEGAFTGAQGQYRYQKNGGQTQIQFDTNGDGAADRYVTISNGEFNLVEQLGDKLRMTTTSGDDFVIGAAEADTIDGLAGNDSVNGSDGDDSIYGNSGDDTLVGGSGDDTVRGDDGADLLFAGLGDDRADGGVGDDFARTSNGRDTLIGGDGNDTLGAGSGGDLLNGGAGADFLLASNGNDRLNSGDGNDTLQGGNGRDTLTGGAGDDRLVGGAHNDRFNFAPGSGADVIVDFAEGAASGDVIGLIGFGAAFDDFADVLAASTQVGANVIIDLGAGDSITLQGVTLGNLNAGDFAFG